jgi:hypothetical protein
VSPSRSGALVLVAGASWPSLRTGAADLLALLVGPGPHQHVESRGPQRAGQVDHPPLAAYQQGPGPGRPGDAEPPGAWVLLLDADDGAEPLFLQAKRPSRPFSRSTAGAASTATRASGSSRART